MKNYCPQKRVPSPFVTFLFLINTNTVQIQEVASSSDTLHIVLNKQGQPVQAKGVPKAHSLHKVWGSISRYRRFPGKSKYSRLYFHRSRKHSLSLVLTPSLQLKSEDITKEKQIATCDVSESGTQRFIPFQQDFYFNVSPLRTLKNNFTITFYTKYNSLPPVCVCIEERGWGNLYSNCQPLGRIVGGFNFRKPFLL